MRRVFSKRNPAFLWQALLILGPVILLAVFGLISLRQDRRLAEGDARDRAQTMADVLTRECRLQVENDLTSFITATEIRRQTAIRLVAGRVEQPHSSNGVSQSAAEARPLLRVRCRGEGTRLIEPPAAPAVPEPPEWLQTVPGQWLKTWEKAKVSLNPGGDVETARRLLQELANSGVGPLVANARLTLAALQDDADKTDTLFSLVGSLGATTTDSGILLTDLALLQALRSVPGRDFAVFSKLIAASTSALLEHPSFLSENILTELQRQATAYGPEGRERVLTVNGLWEEDNRARDVLQEWFARTAGRGSNAFLEIDAGSFFILPATRETNTAQEYSPSGGGSGASTEERGGRWNVMLVPVTVVEASLKSVATRLASRWPPYLGATFEMNGWKREFIGQDRGQKPSAPAMATQTDAFSGPAVPCPFAIGVQLVNPELLYARQQQRVWLFGGLIFCAGCVALVGAWLLWRNLERQFKLNEAKSNFVSSVSHELRAPIASVRLMAESLEQGKIKEPHKLQEYFRFISQECRRLSSLIENVLDFARIEQGRKEYEFEPTDMRALVSQTVRLMEPYAAERHIKLEIKVPKSVSNAPHVNADGKALQQAVINLIDNAVKHSRPNELVTVGLESATPESSEPGMKQRLLIWVEDRGEGIPAHEQERIFERFYRVGSELRRETQGVGIGLSIVKHTVEAHGGAVRVRSEVGRGSRFTIDLPMYDSGANGQEGGPPARTLLVLFVFLL